MKVSFDHNKCIMLLGWMTLLKGIEKVMFPGRVNKAAQWFEKGQRWWGFVILLIGVWYLWNGLRFQP